MLCEMCGKEVPVLRTVVIDGATLRVCERCSRFGTEVRPPASPVMAKRRAVPRRRIERDIFEEMVEDLAEDYPQRIRQARQRMGLNQEELGQRIGERKSVIHQLETGHMVPDDRLVAKLERFLGIHLRVPREDLHPRVTSSDGAVTIGDFVDLRT